MTELSVKNLLLKYSPKKKNSEFINIFKLFFFKNYLVQILVLILIISFILLFKNILSIIKKIKDEKFLKLKIIKQLKENENKKIKHNDCDCSVLLDLDIDLE